MERRGVTAMSAQKEASCEGYHCLLRRVFIGGIAVVLAFAILREVRSPSTHASLEPGYAVPAASERLD